MSYQVTFGLIAIMLIYSPATGNPFQRWEIKQIIGGYEDILIGINGRVAQDQTIIDNLKSYMTKFSLALYNATHQRLYLRKVTILVPQGWTGSYGDAGKEGFQFANVIIDEGSTGDTPYVRRSLPECGTPGEYIHLTPGYVINGDSSSFRGMYGEPGNVLLHEWAHLRWGLGDEYPRTDRGEDHFYFGDGEKPPWAGSEWVRPAEPVRCSLGMSGVWKDIDTGNNGCSNGLNGLPDDRCRFKPWTRSKGQQARASILFDQGIDTVHEFCDNSTDKNLAHNSKAPNEQNKICGGRSSWEVMREHPDFQDAAQLDLVTPDLLPAFQVVQRKVTDRVVLVLDVSGSMGSVDTGQTVSRVERLGADAGLYIRNVVSDGTDVGVIKFNSAATLVRSLTRVDRERDDLARSVMLVHGGNTCIGCGILAAIQELETTGPAAGGSIVLISDGLDGNAAKFSEAQAAVEAKGVVIDAILYTVNADPRIHALARVSQGRVFYEEGSTTNLIQGLIETEAQRKSRSPDAPVQLLVKNLEIEAASNKFIPFTMDESVGTGTRILLTYPATTAADDVIISIIDPDGATLPEEYATVDNTTRTYDIRIPGTAQPGKWLVYIRNEADFPITTQLLVLSKPSAGNDVITTRAFITADRVDFTDPNFKPARVVAEVTRGYAPVLNADVIAYVQYGIDDVTEITLRDNGLGPDMGRNDGFYTGYFLGYKSDGKYAVKVTVSNSGGRASVVTGGGSGAYTPNNTDSYTTEPLGGFDRSTSGGYFEADNYNGAADMFPPSQIQDLTITAMFYQNSTLSFAWTAMGEDMDQNGPASYYELRYCESDQQLRDHFSSCTLITESDVISGNLSSPSDPYTKEFLTISLPPAQANTTYYFGIKSVDDDGQMSLLSNVLPAGVYYIPPRLDTTATSTVTSPDMTSSVPTAAAMTYLVTSDTTTVSPEAEKREWYIIGGAVGALGGVIIAAVLATILFVLRSRHGRSKRHRQGHSAPPSGYRIPRAHARPRDRMTYEAEYARAAYGGRYGDYERRGYDNLSYHSYR